jgi:hypothetical protein
MQTQTPNKINVRGDKKSPSHKNGNILTDKEGYTLTPQQAQWKIRSLKTAKQRDPELFELNGGDLDLLQLQQHIQLSKNGGF